MESIFYTILFIGAVSFGVYLVQQHVSKQEEALRREQQLASQREYDNRKIKEQRARAAMQARRNSASGLNVEVSLEHNPEPYWSYNNSVYFDQMEETYRLAALSRIGIDPTPAKLKARRTELRKLYREAIAAGDEAKEIEALNGLYQYALLVVYCYGPFDNNGSVIGWQYGEAIKALWKNDVEKVFSILEYKKDGRIKDCKCLSETDWKHFEKRWGQINGEVDLRNLFGSYPGLTQVR